MGVVAASFLLPLIASRLLTTSIAFRRIFKPKVQHDRRCFRAAQGGRSSFISAVDTKLPVAAAGWCAQCARKHSLPRTPDAEYHALKLLESIEAAGRFDFEVDSSCSDARFQIENIFRNESGRKHRGKMLGVLVCDDGTVLRAFSGLLDGVSACPGWVGPVALLLESSEFAGRFAEIVEHVKLAKVASEPSRIEHRKLHKILSQRLSADLANSVVFRNSLGRVGRLPALMKEHEHKMQEKGKKTRNANRVDVGTCAAPKLLHAAYSLNLQPKSLAEVWFENPRGRAPEMSHPQHRVTEELREHGGFYQACVERCEPIMGFLLCGLKCVE